VTVTSWYADMGGAGRRGESFLSPSVRVKKKGGKSK
jgi:hypothetical protein